MSTKHTPGPLEKVSNFVRTSMLDDGTRRGVMVAECFDQHGDRYSDEAKANARLFAAAPDLLAPLEGVVTILEHYARNREDCVRRLQALMPAMCAAIAKAGGAS